MRVRDKTKNKIANSMIILLKKKPLDKITITDITSNCDMTRQIFYRYFIDKYDLINWIYGQDCDILLQNDGKEFSWKLVLTHLVSIVKEKKDFYYYAIKSEDANSLEKLILKRLIFYNTNIIEYRIGNDVTEELSFFIKMYCMGTVSMLVEEIKKGMPKREIQLVNWLLEAMPKKIEQLLLNYTVPVKVVKQWKQE